MKFKMTRRQKRETLFGYIFTGPQIIGYLSFVLFPMVFSLVLCFCQWDLSDTLTFVGFKNFEAIFRDTIFWKSIGNTFIYLLIVVPLTLLTSLTLALLTNRKLPFMKFYRAAFFLPMVTSTVAIAMVWTFIYQPEGGIINAFLNSLGVVNAPRWLLDPKFARWAVSILSIWLKAGYYYIIFDAGLKNIPNELYEAADIDGASLFRKVIKITIPMLSSVMFFVSVMLFIDVFNMFNEVYIMTSGGPDYSTYTLSMYIYFYAFNQFDMGRAAVASWILFAFVGIVTAIQFIIKKKVVYE